MSVTVKDIVLGMKELLSDPKRWTKHVGARNERGEVCSTVSDEASCFCLWGAEVRTLHDKRLLGSYRGPKGGYNIEDAADNLLKAVAKEFSGDSGGDSVSGFNDRDTTTYEDVMKFLDTCIERAT